MEQREIDESFFEMPTLQRRETTAGQSLLAESRGLFDFVTEIIDAHDLFSKHSCTSTALILMKRALIRAEPIYRLTKSNPHTGA